MDITKEEFFGFLNRLFQYNPDIVDRTITFEISESEKYDNFLTKIFAEEFKSSWVILSDKMKQNIEDGFKPYYLGVTSPGQFTIKLKIKE